MITSLTLNADFTPEMSAIVVEDSEILGLTSKNSTSTSNKHEFQDSKEIAIPVYIPSIIPNIKKGKPKESNLTTKGLSVFKNANNKPTITSQVLHEQNYITCKKFKDSYIDNFKLLAKTVMDEDHINKMTYTLKKDTSGKITFLDSKLSDLAITFIDGSISDNKTEVTIDKKKRTYYTEEHQVGTWIDNKKIWERTIIATLPGEYSQPLVINIQNVSEAIQYFAMMGNGVMFPSDDGNGNNITFSNNGKLAITTNRWYGQQIKITCQYTKKIDLYVPPKIT